METQLDNQLYLKRRYQAELRKKLASLSDQLNPEEKGQQLRQWLRQMIEADRAIIEARTARYLRQTQANKLSILSRLLTIRDHYRLGLLRELISTYHRDQTF